MATLQDKIVSTLSYYTLGIFSMLYLIFCAVTKKEISKFLMFNIYQSIFLSLLIYVVSVLIQIAVKIVTLIPFIGKIVFSAFIYVAATPIFCGHTIVEIALLSFLTYLVALVWASKQSYIPYISDMIKQIVR